MRVLLVEDDTVLSETLQYNLQREGYQVLHSTDAENALRLFQSETPDLVLLDVMLPSRSGFELCRLIREQNQTPIIFLTAKAGEEDRVTGLDMGADDYIVKPFSMKELLARVRTVLRRTMPVPTERLLKVDGLEIDLEARRVMRAGQEIPLSPKEFALLTLLASNPGRAFSRDQLLDRVWGINAYISPRTVDVHIRWLRSKIESEPDKPRHIVTVRGSGYRFEA
jgi:phosphate regulon transcriptional regulator PhoB